MKSSLREDLKWCTEKLLAMHSQAKIGHLGGNLSCLPGLCAVAAQLRPDDRLILSKGHSAGALYVTLARHGFIEESELETFHKDDTRLPGHPPANLFPQIPFATGSLGHGLSLAAGFAYSQKLRQTENQIYCLTSDGEWQEGSTWEALIFAVHNRLTNLTILVDHNGLQGFGSTREVASMDPLWERIRGFDIETEVIDGHDVDLIASRIHERAPRLRILFLKTIKGKGVAEFEGRVKSHYLPITDAQFELAMNEAREKTLS